MKHNLLLIALFSSTCIIGMERSKSSEEFIQAIQQGDFQRVVNLFNSDATLQNNVRTYTNYATEPVLKFAVRNPGLTAQYMKIARFLVDRGANIHSQALGKLKEYEQSQRVQPAQPSYPSATAPLYQNPVIEQLILIKKSGQPINYAQYSTVALQHWANETSRLVAPESKQLIMDIASRIGDTPYNTWEYLNKINQEYKNALATAQKSVPAPQPAPYIPSRPTPPAVQPVQPSVATQPTSQPTPLVQPQASPATAEKYQTLLKAIRDRNPNEVKNILSKIDSKELSAAQQEDLFSTADGLFAGYISSYAQLLQGKEIIKQLLAKGWKPSSPRIKNLTDLHLKNQGLGPRTELIKTPLIEAILKFDVASVNRLITQEKVDVNETDSIGTSPLKYAAANPNKEILALLLKNGAQLGENVSGYDKAQLAKLIAEMNLK